MPYQTPRHAQPERSGGLDLKTLWITAASSAAAAYACSRLWAPGTLAAAAFTPVLVALIKEALAKSTEVVTRAVPPVKGVVRSTPPQDSQPLQPTPAQPAADIPAEVPVAAERVAQSGEIQYHGGRGWRGWRLAIVTGLAGFLVCAVVFTVPELVAGGSASGGGRDTTLFGGGTQRDRDEPAVTTQTTTAPAETVTAPPPSTVTVPPAATVTVPAPEAATTTPQTPAPTTPVPGGEPDVAQPPAPQAPS